MSNIYNTPPPLLNYDVGKENILAASNANTAFTGTVTNSVLRAFTLPANSLLALPSQRLKIEAFGTYVGNVGNRVLKLRANGSIIATATIAGVGASNGWSFLAWIIPFSAGSINGNVFVYHGYAATGVAASAATTLAINILPSVSLLADVAFDLVVDIPGAGDSFGALGSIVSII